MDERISRVLEKMKEKGIDQLLVSDPLSIRFLTGIMVNPGERLYALLLRTSGKHTLFLNYLYYVSNTGFEEVWFSDMDDQIGVLMEHIDTKSTLGIDKTWPARFLIPLQERCPEMKTVWGSDCVDGVRAVEHCAILHGAGRRAVQCRGVHSAGHTGGLHPLGAAAKCVCAPQQVFLCGLSDPPCHHSAPGG